MRVYEGIDGLVVLLQKAGLELGAEEIADALWLASYINPEVREYAIDTDSEEAFTQPDTDVQDEYLSEIVEADSEEPAYSISVPRGQNSQESNQTKAKSDSIPIKAPAAPALRIRLELSRALRPLRRRVPSPTIVDVDEAATIEQIADQGIWSPVLSPGLEPWLEVALVIEENKSSFLWKETLAEFQTLLERQGAFRTVIPWRLRSDDSGKLTLVASQSNRARSFRELLDSAERRLILVVSDCTSAAWYKGTIHSWLETWGKKAPTTIIQLLPERLWAQTGLAHGLPVWLSSVEPGAPNARMIVATQMSLWGGWTTHPQVTVPVVSLEVEPLKQWAEAITNTGTSRMIGFQFEKQEWLEDTGFAFEEVEKQELSSLERVRLFRATASLTAQKLAALMSVASVNPSVVNLIRQTMLPEAGPVHVAEVYMGGLMMADADGEDNFDFIPEVQDILANALSITETDEVLDRISRYITLHAGLSINSFDARLNIDRDKNNTDLKDILRSFAKVSAQTFEPMTHIDDIVADSEDEYEVQMFEEVLKEEEEEGREVATISAWFQSRNLELQGSYQPEPAIDELFDDLAVYLGDNYKILERFYKKLKSSLGKRCPFLLQDKSQKEISIHNLFFKKLKDSSLLSKGFYNKSDKIIIATTQNKEDVKYFLEGGWFERFVCYKIVDFLDSVGADYQVLRNLDITYANEGNFELDIFFMIQGQPLLVECKAGKQFDSGIETFTKQKQQFSLQPENAIFVALELEERLTAVRTKQMGVTVANKDTFLSHIEQLLAIRIGQDSEVRSIGAAWENSSTSSEPSSAVTDVDILDETDTVDLKHIFSKREINLAPEHRKVVINELIQIFQEPDTALSFTQLIREIKDRLEDTPNKLSRNKITEILDALRRSRCFLTKSKRPVLNVGKPIERLTSVNMNTLEQRCLRHYMKEVSKEVGPDFFDDPANVAQFNQLTHGDIILQ